MYASVDYNQEAVQELEEEFQKDREGIDQFIKAHNKEETGMLATFAKDMGVRLAHHTARSLFYQELSKGSEVEPSKNIHAWRRYHMDELFEVKRVLFAAAFHIFFTLKRILRVMILRFNLTRLRDQKAI